MSLIGTVISLASGAIGGNVAGALMKKFSMGTLGNSLVGILGGGLGGGLLNMIGVDAATAADAANNMDISSILGSVASGGVGGGALMAIIGVIKNAMGGTKS